MNSLPPLCLYSPTSNHLVQPCTGFSISCTTPFKIAPFRGQSGFFAALTSTPARSENTIFNVVTVNLAVQASHSKD